MPYISQKAREAIALGSDAMNAGELNYVITQLVNNYLKQYEESYSKYNEVIGVLECAKMELYRRKVVDYEDRKIATNGDVF